MLPQVSAKKLLGETFIIRNLSEKQVSKISKNHTGERNFPCDVCNNKFCQKSSTAQNWIVHTCQKSFLFTEIQSKKLFNIDIAIHTGEQNFVSSVYVYRCDRKTGVVWLYKIYTKSENFACIICNHKFSEKSSIIKHIRIHTGEKSFVCPVGDYEI